MSEKWAARIAALLANAEDAAKRGEEIECQKFLDKATALQLKFAIDDAMLAKAGNDSTDKIIHMDFCQESNTPLIKAKRELINSLAYLYRGKAVMLGEYERDASGQMIYRTFRGKYQAVYNRRAKVRVHAHESDLRFISQMYTSLILQMQTMMAADERLGRGGVSAIGAWRVSYAYAWVRRVVARLNEAKRRQEHEANTGTPGTALVLRDRTALVADHITSQYGTLRKGGYRQDDDGSGTAAGRAAGDRADLGQRKVAADSAKRIEG